MDRHKDESFRSSSSEDSEYENKITTEDAHSEDMASNNNDSSSSASTLPLTDSSSADTDSENADDDCGPEFNATAQGKLLLAMIDHKSECVHCGKQVKHMASHLKIVHGPGKPKEIVNCGFCGKDFLMSEFYTHVTFAHSTPSPPSSPPASRDGSSNCDYEEVESSVQEKFEINNNADVVVKPNDTYNNPDFKPDVKLEAEVQKSEVVPADSKNIEISAVNVVDDKVAKITIVPDKSSRLQAVDVEVRGDLKVPVRELKRKYVQYAQNAQKE